MGIIQSLPIITLHITVSCNSHLSNKKKEKKKDDNNGGGDRLLIPRSTPQPQEDAPIKERHTDDDRCWAEGVWGTPLQHVWAAV